jgi:CysZ protein
MLTDLKQAVADLKRPAVLGSIVACALASLMVGIGLSWGANHFLSTMEISAWGWLDWLIDALGTLGAIAVSVLLFPLIMTALTGLVAEYLLDPVEQAHYPDLPPTHEASLLTSLRSAIAFLATAIGLNLIVLIVGLIVPGINLLLALALNGYLLSREFIELVAARRLPMNDVRHWRRQNRRKVAGYGLLLAILFVIPVVNLIAPVLAALMICHWLARSGIYQSAPSLAPTQATLVDQLPD